MIIMDGHQVEVVALTNNAGGSMDAWGQADMQQAYRCEWGARFDVLAFLLGYPPGPTYLGVSRDPHRYPGLPALVALEADWEGVGKSFLDPALNALAYPQALIKVKYGVPNYTTGPATKQEDLPNYAEEHFESTAYVDTAGPNVYRWAAGHGKLETRVGVKTYGWDRVYTLRRVTSINWPSIKLALNHLNDREWRGVPRGQMLFSSISTKRNIGPSFQPIEVTLRLSELDHDHNHLYRPGRGFEEVSPLIYSYVDFRQIFVFIV
jgi:hypothetical protein